MEKLLFLATYPTQSNGYARVANILSNYLANFYEVYYFGFSNYVSEDVVSVIPRYIDPRIKLIDVIEEESKRASKETFGVGIILEFVEKIKPEVIFIYNDLIVSCRHFNKLNQVKDRLGFRVINYIDLVYDYENPVYIRHMNRSTDKILVFSQHWRNNLIDMGIPSEKIDILLHGIDLNLFKRVDRNEARRAFGFRDEDFLFLNTNRNSYRKATDITISAFILVLKRLNFNERVKLVLHMDFEVNTGYKLRNLIETECMKHRVDSDYVMNKFIFRVGDSKLTDERMNLLYNACDVGLNTCIGEGFGLCNIEHAYLGKPQVVSRVGGLKDIFEDFVEFTIEPCAEYNVSSHTDDHNGVARLCRAEDFAERMLDIYREYNKYTEIAERCSKYIGEKYRWDRILSLFKNIPGIIVPK